MSERSSRPLSPKSNAPAGGAALETQAPGSVGAGSAPRVAPLRDPSPRVAPPLVMGPVVPADEVAQMALALRADAEAKAAASHCDACGAEIEGEPAGSGLYLWSRGEDDVRFEEPPLCADCATAIGTTALRKWDEEDEEEG